MWEIWVPFLGWENPLEKVMATHSSILACRIPWTEEPAALQSMGLQKAGHDWTTNTKPLIRGKVKTYFTVLKVIMIYSLRSLNFHTTISILKKLMWKNIPIAFLFQIFIYLAVRFSLVAAYGIYFSDQGSVLSPLHWECRVLATEPPGEFCPLFFVYYSDFLIWVRKISPGFHHLFTYFKSFFSVWILLLQTKSWPG